jgi:prephenate dehydrogenase
MKKPLFNKICIVGVGLIGGSLGMATKKRKLAKLVVGVVRTDYTVVAEAKRKKAVDKIVFSLEEGVRGADLVVLSSQVFTIIERIKQIRPFLKKDALVIDVGSSKFKICAAAKKYLPVSQFVGCHPMAGSERSGVQFARADLFENSYCFIEKKQWKVERFWKSLGAEPVQLDPKNHDRWVAQVSHLPHLNAFASFQKWKDVQRYIFSRSLKYLNPSIRELARLSKSKPEIWAGILSSNSEFVLKSLDEFESNLKLYKAALRLKSDKVRTLKLLKLLRVAQKNAFSLTFNDM